MPRSERSRVTLLSLGRWLHALAHCVRLHLRAPRADVAPALQGVLEPHELEFLLVSVHRPNCCLQVLTHLIRSSFGGYGGDVPSSLRLDDSLRRIEDAIGGLERTFRTPIPLSYTRHTSRTLLFWLFYMPVGLAAELQVQALLLAPLLVLVLFGTDEIGVELEEPLSILPLEQLCQSVADQTGELLRRDEETQALVERWGRAADGVAR
jgi:predicted membrane chloride channel (bestrophin family)